MVPALFLIAAAFAAEDCSTLPTGSKGGTSCSVDATSSPDWSMKGWEVYSWHSDGRWHYALIRGTNRMKEAFEIRSADVGGAQALEVRLTHLPKGSSISWVKPKLEGIEFKRPAKGTISRLSGSCKRLGLSCYWD